MALERRYRRRHQMIRLERRIIRDRGNPMDVDDTVLFARYRFTRLTILFIVNIVAEKLDSAFMKRSMALPPLYKELVALRFFATGAHFRLIGESLGVSVASVSRCIFEVARVLVRQVKKFIQYPRQEATSAVKHGFYRISGENMAPPGPPYNVPPTNEDVKPPTCAPSGQKYSEHPHDEMFVPTEDTSIDAASLQETVSSEVSSMVGNLTLHSSQIMRSNSMQPAMFEHRLVASGTSSLNQGAQSFGTQSSMLDDSSTFNIWIEERQMSGQVVVATDVNGSNYEIRHGVMKPELAKIEERLHTYSRWPRDSYFSSKSAASAGLYCVGGTYLKCFACGGGLDGWEQGDDPLREHARYYKWCPYVAALLLERFLT